MCPNKQNERSVGGTDPHRGAERLPTVAAIGTAGEPAALVDSFEALAAAGGTEAGIAFVVVGELLSDPECLLPLLGQRVPALPASTVRKRVALKPGEIYVVPPGRRLVFDDGFIDSVPFDSRSRRRTPVDDCFRRLAQAYPESVALILSGEGTHGALGARAIKAAGGLLLVQTPQEAPVDGMPRAAIATGMADLVLPVAVLARRLLQYLAASRQSLPSAPEMTAQERRQLPQILARLEQEEGHGLHFFAPATVRRRIRRRMRLQGQQTPAAYLRYLHEQEGEARALLADLYARDTTFFDPARGWDALAQAVLPRLFGAKAPDEPLRVWSIGCASGEEAYTLAILLLEEAGRHASPPAIQVFASDLDQRQLRQARQGVYPGVVDADVSPERLQRFFRQEGSYYRVRHALRDVVLFAQHDLLHDPPFIHLDLLLAGPGLLSDLTPPLWQRVQKIFHYALNPGGYLFLPDGERPVPEADLFRRMDEAQFLYRARPWPEQDPPPPAIRPPGARKRLQPAPGPQTPLQVTLSLVQSHRQALEEAGGASMLVDEHQAVLHLSEGAGRYLRPGRGPLSANLHQLIRAELKEDLEIALTRALYQQQPTLTAPVTIVLEGKPHRVVVAVRPQPAPAAGGREPSRALLLFLADELPAPDTPAAAGADSDGNLQEELARVRQQAQVSAQAYRMANQELGAVNEQLQTVNEALLTTTHELETNREELQTLNEELRAANAELTNKVEELSRTYGDLHNLIAASELPALFLDRNLRLRRYTPGTHALFNISHADHGRPLADVNHRLAYDALVQDARKVLRTLRPLTREIATTPGEDRRWLLARFRPYRAAEQRIDGLVLSFVDVTELKETEQALRARERELEALNQTLEARVEMRTAEVRDLALRLTMAEQQERAHVARILHDDLQQHLYALQIQLTFLDDVADETVQRELPGLNQTLRNALKITRHLSVDLSPPILAGEGLREAIGWLAAQMAEQYGLAVTLSTEPRNTSFPVPAEDRRVLLFQMARELLFNVVKHAQVSKATVELRVVEEPPMGRAYRICVSDEGVGFEPEQILGAGARPDGRGLPYMQERLHLIGGRLEVRSAPGAGSRLRIVVPAAAGEERGAHQG